MAVRRRLAARRFRPARVKSESHGVGCCWGVGATEGLYTAVSVNGACHPIKFWHPLTLLSRCVGDSRAPRMSTEVAQAQAEEVTLRLADNKTGYFGVYLTKPGQPKPYLAQVKRGGRKVYLGMFATVEEAALCVARSPEGQAAAVRAAAPPPAPPLTSEVAKQQAQAEGLTLVVAENTTGYFGVYLDKPGKPKPYMAKVSRGGKMVHLGSFATAEEAALCVARSPEGQAVAQAAAGRTAAAPPLTSEEARQHAQVEGLTLRVADNTTGYLGVHHQPDRTKPYQAQVWRGGKNVRLGSFATAEEAALCVARSPKGRAAAGTRTTAVLPPPASEVEVKDEPVQSGAIRKEEDMVPAMPSGAFVKEEEEEEVIPSMPPGARWGVEVEDPMPMASDATAKQPRSPLDQHHALCLG
eukprot:scaffold36400_cov50-Phaeocystis_antarctica.AAC.1